MMRSPFVPLLLAGLLGAACHEGSGAEDEGASSLMVFAAASTTDVITEVVALPREDEVKTSFGSSSALARQIRDGAPADIYVSASRRWIEFLRDEDVLDGEPHVFCHNRLVCVAPRGSALADDPPADARELVPAITTGDRVAIADAGVPAGEYARQSLTATGDLEAMQPLLVGQADVRAVLRAVERGEAAAGFVYATDARVADVAELFAFDPSTHTAIEYFAAVPRHAPSPVEAHVFLDELASEPVRRILEETGFLPAPR